MARPTVSRLAAVTKLDAVIAALGATADALAALRIAINALSEIRDALATAGPDHDPLTLYLPMGCTLREAEDEVIRQTLAAEGGNRTRTAARLGIGRRTLLTRLQEMERKRPAGAEGESLGGVGQAG